VAIWRLSIRLYPQFGDRLFNSLHLSHGATQLIRINPPFVFWSTVFFSLCIPGSWLLTLRGYPDTGAALFIALALWIYLKNTRLKHGWQIPLIGILLTFAFLWRRHFAYSGIALILTFIIQGILTYLKEKNIKSPKAINNLIEYQIKIALIGVTSFLALGLIARPYLLLAIQRNYTDLYQSYVRPYGELLHQYLRFYGISLLAVSILGLVMASGKLNRQPYRIVFIFYAICTIEWIGILRYGGFHYTIHFTPLVILGVISLVWVIIRATSTPIRTGLVWAIIGYLILNLILSFTPLGKPFSRPPRNILFSLYSPPPYREDYPELLRLVKALRRLAPNQETLYFVGSSSAFNYSLIVSAEKELYGQDGSKLYIRQTPIVDSRDWYPLEQFLQAKYVIIAKPFQHHLTLEETDVEKVIYDIFDRNWQIKTDFQQLPLEFKLENNIKLVIYQRVQNTSVELALKTFIRMKERIGDRPGNQPPWIALNPNFQTAILPQSDTYTVATSFNEQNYDQILDILWINALPNPFILTGKPVFSSDVCPESNLRLSWINPQGESEYLTETSLRVEDASVFELPLQPVSEGYLNLSLRVADPKTFTTTCYLRIDRLNLE